MKCELIETKKVFESYTEEEITDEIAEEIENNLANFFTMLLQWQSNTKINEIQE